MKDPDDIPEDYIEAAAAVVEAARKADEARRKHKEAQEAVLETYAGQTSAEKELHDALEKLKQASTGRDGRTRG